MALLLLYAASFFALAFNVIWKIIYWPHEDRDWSLWFVAAMLVLYPAQ